MESLRGETWDVIIVGTSIPQSLLALSLSRSGKKVLHVDRHTYYGGHDAGLSLQDAAEWVQDLDTTPSPVFKDASIWQATSEGVSSPKEALSSSRSYTLCLNPQILYAQSQFLPTLVSSRIHIQLEFLAVGSWWVHRDGALHKIPSTREDVFNDESLSMKDKRSLMKFLRYVLQEESEPVGVAEGESQMSLQAVLDNRFKIPKSLQAPVLALALSPVAANSISFDDALVRIRRHMRSMGYFGPGFGAVVAKYGGNSEISQVACRAGAVGGGVYLLGHDLKSLSAIPVDTSDTSSDGSESRRVEGVLSDGTRITARFVAGSADDLPTTEQIPLEHGPSSDTWRSVNIVADTLRGLFPQTSDNGPVPAAAIVLVDTGGSNSGENPVYLQIHSEDTGECPAGQSIIYASVNAEDTSSKQRLEAAVRQFLHTTGTVGSLLWSLSYLASGPALASTSTSPRLTQIPPPFLVFPPEPHDISFPDNVLETVKEAWEAILGADAADGSFLKFEERESEIED